MDKDLRNGHWKSPTRKQLLKSTFPSMMESYMSADELSKHLGRQMSIQAETYQEPEGEIMEANEKGERRIKRKNTKLSKQQSHHGIILEGLDHEKIQHVAAMNAEKAIFEEEDEEEQHNIIKLKEQEHDDLIQGLIQLRDYYKREYKKALQEKVEHQKKLILERKNKKIEEQKRSEEIEKGLLHRVPQKLPKSVLVKDVQVKTSLQTDYYKIISLENKLKKDGYLNKNHEITAFWDFVTAPGNLESVIRDGQLSWETIKNYHENSNKTSLAAHRERGDKNQLVRRVKNRVSYQGRSSRWRRKIHGIRTILSPWSSSDIPCGSGKSGPPVSGGKPRVKNNSQSLAISIEKKFPKVEFPPLAAYRLEFGKVVPSLEEVRKLEETEKKLQERNDLKRTLHTMFSHALANRAATQRLMEKNQDYNFEKLSGAAIIDEFHELNTKPSSGTLKGQDSRHGSSTSAGRSSLPVSRKTHKKRTEARQTKFEVDSQDVSESSLSFSSREDLTVELPPLTMNQVADSCVVMEAQCLSTLWVNPL